MCIRDRSETDGPEILMNNLLEQSIELDLLDTETIAIDTSKLEAYERANPRSKIDKKILLPLIGMINLTPIKIR